MKRAMGCCTTILISLTILFLNKPALAVPIDPAVDAKAIVGLISLLKDVKELTTGLTLNQAAVSVRTSIIIPDNIPPEIVDGPKEDKGIFGAFAKSQLQVGTASAVATAQAKVGALEPLSSSGTVLSVTPTQAIAGKVGDKKAGATAAATAALSGSVTSKGVIQPASTTLNLVSVPVLFALELQDMQAQIADGTVNGALNFDFTLDFPDGSANSDMVLVKGQIGGTGNQISFPSLERTDLGLASQLRTQFLTTFAPDASGKIVVTEYFLGAGILPIGQEGIVFNTTLDEEYRIIGNLSASAVAAVVPEPPIFMLLGTGILGLLGCCGWRHRKRVS